METDQAEQSLNWKTTFFTIWVGQAFSIVGSSVAGFALIWWLTRSTGSATVLAMGTLVSMLPGIFLGPLAGACVDRWNRRLVMIVADSVIALISAWLAYLFWSGAIQIWHVYVIMFARSIGGTFHWPAMQASTSLMVPKQHLTRIAGLNQTIQGALSTMSPPLGALLLSLLPLHGIMAIDVVTAAIAVSCLLFIRIPQPQRQPSTGVQVSKPSILQDLRQGLLYVWHWPGVLAIMVIATVLNFLINPAFSLMPILITKHFGGQALQLGWINSAWGIGCVAGGLVLSAWGGFRRRMVTSLAGLIGMGIGTLAIGLSPANAFWLALVGMLIFGFMNPIGNGPLFAVIQAVVAPDMQGRVFTLIGSAAGAMSPLGLAIAGPVADAFGVQLWYVVGGIGCLLMGAGSFFVRPLMHLEDGSSQAATGAEESEQGALLCAPTPGPAQHTGAQQCARVLGGDGPDGPSTRTAVL